MRHLEHSLQLKELLVLLCSQALHQCLIQALQLLALLQALCLGRYQLLQLETAWRVTVWLVAASRLQWADLAQGLEEWEWEVCMVATEAMAGWEATGDTECRQAIKWWTRWISTSLGSARWQAWWSKMQVVLLNSSYCLGKWQSRVFLQGRVWRLKATRRLLRCYPKWESCWGRSSNK